MMRLGYSEILRVIGDDLERRGLKAFELEALRRPLRRPLRLPISSSGYAADSGISRR